MTSNAVSTRGFQSPRHVDSPAGLYFYHSIDLPQYGLQVGHWDLRPGVDAYLGRQQFEGLTVADVGAASGFISFELERRGANVIAFDRDLSEYDDDMGLVPFADFESRFGLTMKDAVTERLRMQRKLQDSFWLAHRLLESKARLYCGNVYTGMPDVGTIDVSFFGCILLHLRDPLLALTKFGSITTRSLIITDTYEDVGPSSEAPVMFLRPNVNDRTNLATWWSATPKLLQTFLQILGFRQFTLTHHRARYVQSNADVPMYTLVATR